MHLSLARPYAVRFLRPPRGLFLFAGGVRWHGGPFVCFSGLGKGSIGKTPPESPVTKAPPFCPADSRGLIWLYAAFSAFAAARRLPEKRLRAGPLPEETGTPYIGQASAVPTVTRFPRVPCFPCFPCFPRFSPSRSKPGRRKFQPPVSLCLPLFPPVRPCPSLPVPALRQGGVNNLCRSANTNGGVK